MNKVVLIGRLTRDPELRYTGNNTPVASFTLAVDRAYSSQQGEREADFINIVVWNKPAENVKNYLTKGSQVAIDGRIQTRSYDDQNGQKRYVTEVVANNVEFVGSKNSSNNTSNMSSSGGNNGEISPYDNKFSPEPKGTDVGERDPFAEFGANIEISDDELPF